MKTLLTIDDDSQSSAPEGYRHCECCPEIFKVGARDRNPRKYCSNSCQNKAWRKNNPAHAVKQKISDSEKHRSTYVKRQYDLACAVCGENFLSGRLDRKYCSKACGNRAYASRRRADGRAADMSAKRKALELGVKIQAGRRLSVLEADNWICHLCNLPTNRDAIYPSNDYPVIDHVVPLSKGGEHAPSNWKTAHSLCNMRKGDLSVEEFWERFPIKEVA